MTMERDPNMPNAFRGTVYEGVWNYFRERGPYPEGTMTAEQKAALNANVERWLQEQRDRDAIEIMTRLG